MKNILILLLTSFALFGCVAEKGKTIVDIKKRKSNLSSGLKNTSISTVKIVNHQLIITGVNLTDVEKIKIDGSSFNELFTIESKSANQIIANSVRAFSFDISKAFNLILSDASASASFPIDFSLCQATINGVGFNCSVVPNPNDVLSYDSVTHTWKPRSINGLSYQGSWDATTTPPTATSPGDYYIVSVADASYAVGDWIVWNGTQYDQIVNSNSITTIFGRKGTVVATKGDYDLNKLLDVDLTVAPTNGKVLKYDGAKWVAADDLSGGAPGTITTTELANGAVTDAKIDTVSASKITGTITSAQILDGTIVNADISATAGIVYSKLNIADGDIPAAKISGLPSAASLLTTSITNGDTTHAPNGDILYNTLSGKLNLTGGTLSVGTINGVPTPVGPSDIVNKTYVDNAVSSSGQWTTNGANISRDTGNVGIGTNVPAAPLHIKKSGNGETLRLEDATSPYASYYVGAVRQGWFGYGFNTTDLEFSNEAGGPVAFRTGSNDVRMTISSGGNVGIGTDTPGQKLSVAGTVESTSGGFKFPDGTTQTTAAAGGGGGSQWVTAGNNISYTAGNIGVGTASSDASSKFVIANGTLQQGLEFQPTAGSIRMLSYDRNANAYLPFVLDASTISLTRFVGIGGVAAPSRFFDVMPQTAPNQEIIRIGAAGYNNGFTINQNASENFIYSFDGGNVGIGSPTPSEKLQVAGTIHSTTGGFKFPDGTTQTTAAGGGGSSQWTTAGSDISYSTGNVGIGAAATSAKLSLVTTGSANNLSLDSSGGGIPGASLNILGVLKGYWAVATGATQYFLNAGAGDMIFRSETNRILFGSGAGSSTMTVSDYVTIDSKIALNPAPLSSGFEQNSNGYFNINSSGVVGGRFTVTEAGDVGIGNNTPSAKLEVAGQVKITGGSPGAGKVLTSNASGLATWETPSGGGSSDWTTSGGDIYRATGNVGIGTSTPGANLHLVNASTANAIIETQSDLASSNFLFKKPSQGYYVGVGPGDASMKYQIIDSDSLQNYFTIVPASGNVGIGTSSPLSLLNVHGVATAAPSVNATNPDPFKVTFSNISTVLSIGGTTTFPYSVWLQNSNTNLGGGVYPIALNPSGGNVGVGVMNPSQKLSVDGVVESISGGFKFPDGTTQTTAGITSGALTSASYVLNTNANYAGGRNVGFGSVSTYSFASTGPGSQNVAMGYYTLQKLTSGSSNTAFGDAALPNLSTGSNNVALGQDSLYQTTSGANNIGIGREAGAGNGDGNNNIFIGHNATAISASGSYQLNIGNWIYGDNGSIGIGKNTPAYKLDVVGDINSSGSVRASGVALTSDRRWKKNITPIENAVAKLMKITGVSYYWKRAEYPEKDFSDKKQIGVIAQDVEAVFPELILKDKEGYLSVNYPALIAPLIEAFKEQQNQIATNTKMFKVMQGELSEVKAMTLENKREIASVKDENKILKAKILELEKENKSFQARLLRLEKLIK